MFRFHRPSLWNFAVGPFVHGRSMGERLEVERDTVSSGDDSAGSRRLTSHSSSHAAMATCWHASDFAVHEQIGRGNFGHVVRATLLQRQDGRDDDDDDNGQIVALKRFCKQKIAKLQEQGHRTHELLRREIELHSRIRHVHVCSFYGYYCDLQHISLVLEYAPYGDLLNWLYKVNSQYPELRLYHASLILHQMVQAVDHLHQHCIAHRDIKPENIVVARPTCLKLCDFGWAVPYQPHDDLRRTLSGTPEYVAPEMLRDTYYSAPAVDMWALGVLLYEIMHDGTPFSTPVDHDPQLVNGNKKHVAHAIFAKIKKFPGWSINRAYLHTSRNQHQSTAHRHRALAADVMTRLMAVDPRQRPKASELLQHPFLYLHASIEYSDRCYSANAPSATRRPGGRTVTSYDARRDVPRFDREHRAKSPANEESLSLERDMAAMSISPISSQRSPPKFQKECV